MSGFSAPKGTRPFKANSYRQFYARAVASGEIVFKCLYDAGERAITGGRVKPGVAMLAGARG